MESFVSTTPPNVSTNIIGQILTKFYSLENLNYSSVKRLDSWGDLNYYFQCSDGDEYVLKIIKQNDESNSPKIMKSIADVMKFLHSHDYNCCWPIDTVHKDSLIVLRESVLLHGLQMSDDSINNEESTVYTAMVLHYVKGKIAAGIPTSHHMLHAIGHYFGSMDKTLMAFKSTVLMEREYLKYDLKHLPYLRTNYLPMLTTNITADKHEVLVKVIDMYELHVIPAIPTLSQGIIHNDGNMKNIIISNDELFVQGVIDFGDCIHSCHIFELVILLVATFSVPYDVNSVKPLVHGYIEAFPLPVQDMQLLYYVVLGKLAQLYINGHIVCYLNPDEDNSYITKELLPNAWSLIQYLLSTSKLEFDSILNIN